MINKITIKNITLSIFIASFTFIATVFSFHPSRAEANYFGGMKIMSLICTCSGNQIFYINDYATGGELALIYDGTSRLFSNNNIYGIYLLGSYSSGGQCQMTAYPDCITIPSDGMFDSNPGVGTS